MNSAYTKDTFYIVITDFNGFEQTQKCLSAIKSSEFQDFTVIVVDHGTNNQTRKGIEQEFPSVIRLTAAPELWWAGATNTGIQYALENNATAIMLLNNDCYVSKTTIGSLAGLSYDHPEAIIAPVQRDWAKKTIVSINPRSNFLLGFPTIAGSRRLTKKILAKNLISVKLIGGGRGVIIPTSIFKNSGLLDEKRFPHYYADHDFYIRSKKNLVPLFTAVTAVVDIDNRRTSTANQLEKLSLAQFKATFTEMRSHRNFRAVNTLFKMHYPVKSFYLIGTTLFYLRYISVYFLTKTSAMIRKRICP